MRETCNESITEFIQTEYGHTKPNRREIKSRSARIYPP